MRIVRIATATCIAAGLALGMSSCSLIGGAVNQGVENATGGNLTLNGLPSDWPGDVPVVAGEVSGGAKIDNGWTAVVKTSSQTALADAQALLANYGFAVQTDLSQNGTGIVTLVNSHFQVTITGSNDGLLYVITPAQ